MKNKLKYILTFIIVGIVIFSCREDSKIPYPTTSQGAIPLFTQKDDDSGIINLSSPDDTKISFSLDKEGLAPVEDVDVIIIFNNSVSGKSDTVIYQSVSEFPASFSINADQLLAAFPTSVVTIDTLSIGDSFVFGGNVMLKNGTYLDGGYSPSIFTKKPVNLTYSVACPSNIPEGSYTASQDDGAAWFGTTTTKQVTIKKVGVNSYLISDVSAGGYTACCAAFGYKADQPAIISDVCNMITVTGTGGAQIETGQGLAVGSWDESTKTMIVHYDDTFNGSADSGSDLISTFVKN